MGSEVQSPKPDSRLLTSCFLLPASCLWLLASGFLFPNSEFVPQGPFPIRTHNPLYLQTVTLLPERAVVEPHGSWSIEFSNSYSNLFELGISPEAEMLLDMEMWRLSWRAAYGFRPGWEIATEIPLIRLHGGFLDSFVQTFHNTFGLPNGGRNLVADEGFSFRVTRNGQVLYSVDKESMNLQDVSLYLKHQFLDEDRARPGLAARFALKAPTGDRGEGMGSGNPGFGMGIAAEKSHRRWHGYLNLNYLVEGGNEVLDTFVVSEIFDAVLAAEFSISRRVALLGQLVGGTPRLKNMGLKIWDRVPLDLIIGFRGLHPGWFRGKNFFWQIAFSEDPIDKSPSIDFTAWASVGVRLSNKSKD